MCRYSLQIAVFAHLLCALLLEMQCTRDLFINARNVHSPVFFFPLALTLLRIALKALLVALCLADARLAEDMLEIKVGLVGAGELLDEHRAAKRLARVPGVFLVCADLLLQTGAEYSGEQEHLVWTGAGKRWQLKSRTHANSTLARSLRNYSLHARNITH